MDSSLPFVSIVVPVYNDPVGLRTCLEALESQSYPSGSYEVIVVDNNSDEPIDGVVDPCPHAFSEFESKQGSYAARNRGIEVAEGDLLAFTDADCIPSEQWLRAGVKCLQSAGVDYVGGPVEIFFADPEDPSPVGLYDALTSFRQKGNLEQKGFSVTANLLTTRSVFQSVGLFDERLKAGGDREWGRRAYRKGFTPGYCEGAIVRHPARNSLAEMLKKERRVAEGRYRERAFNDYPVPTLLNYVLNELRPPFGLLRKITTMKQAGTTAKRLKVAWLCMRIRWARAAHTVHLWMNDTDKSAKPQKS